MPTETYMLVDSFKANYACLLDKSCEDYDGALVIEALEKMLLKHPMHEHTSWLLMRLHETRQPMAYADYFDQDAIAELLTESVHEYAHTFLLWALWYMVDGD